MNGLAEALRSIATPHACSESWPRGWIRRGACSPRSRRGPRAGTGRGGRARRARAQRADHLAVAGDCAEDRHAAGDDVAAQERGVETDPVVAVGQPDGRLAEQHLELRRPGGAGRPSAVDDPGGGVAFDEQLARGDWLAQQHDHRAAQRLHAPVARGERDLGVAQRLVGHHADHPQPAGLELQRGSHADAAQRRRGRREDRRPRPQLGERLALRRGQRGGVALGVDGQRVERDRVAGPYALDGPAPVGG